MYYLLSNLKINIMNISPSRIFKSRDLMRIEKMFYSFRVRYSL
ncbi:hypothetical protein Mcup_0964 [Metallosphaera cuprina Ar-4]|uniref:Uncharacterized protein n=1 Tax=Metallosphaera cuprina (strain Ar-4) TaxID=1006006 RepID=F4G2M1_METCR|nr:hypothetical protein Mcup_0964 [Metallosphaera cuprina Ar-4]